MNKDHYKGTFQVSVVKWYNTNFQKAGDTYTSEEVTCLQYWVGL